MYNKHMACGRNNNKFKACRSAHGLPIIAQKLHTAYCDNPLSIGTVMAKRFIKTGKGVLADSAGNVLAAGCVNPKLHSIDQGYCAKCTKGLVSYFEVTSSQDFRIVERLFNVPNKTVHEIKKLEDAQRRLGF